MPNLKTKRKDIDWETVQENLGNDEAIVEILSFNFKKNMESIDSIYYAALILTKEIKKPIYIPLFEENKITELIKNNAKNFRLNDNPRKAINNLYAYNNSIYSLI